MSSGTDAAREEARNHGRFGVQARKDPGTDVIGDPPAVVCGRCAKAVAVTGVNPANRAKAGLCTDGGQHVGRAHDLPTVDQLAVDDEVFIWDMRCTVIAVDPHDDRSGNSTLRYWQHFDDGSNPIRGEVLMLPGQFLTRLTPSPSPEPTAIQKLARRAQSALEPFTGRDRDER